MKETSTIVALVPVFLAIIALANAALVGWLAWLSRHQTTMASNIQKIETATNSMKDALVKATGEQKLLEGMAVEKARAKAEKASNAEAVKSSETKP
jgi:hypothetical protein